jgi:hypothetical protein
VRAAAVPGPPKVAAIHPALEERLAEAKRQQEKLKPELGKSKPKTMTTMTTKNPAAVAQLPGALPVVQAVAHPERE